MVSQQFGEGTRVGDLKIVAQLGSGAFGIVYHAHDTLLDRDVALKVIPDPGAGDEAAHRAVIDEARLMCKIDSAHVVRLFRVHDLAPGVGLEMEFVEGGSLEAVLRSGTTLSAERAMGTLRGLAVGIAAVHAAGIVHGDIKPANILIDGDGRAKLTDFGLSRFRVDLELSTEIGSPVGTPRYMAPEVVMGSRATRAADLWGFGIVLYRLVTGREPFHGDSAYELFDAIQNQPAPPLGPGAPPALAEIANSCLAKLPEQRPTDLGAVLEVLDRLTVRSFAAVSAPEARSQPAVFLAGREREVAAMERRLEGPELGKGSAVLLTGDAGIGKSTLLAHLAACARRRAYVWLEVAVSPIHGLLRPLLQRLEQHASGSYRERRIESTQQLIWMVENLLDSISAKAPLGLVLEDAHYAEPEDRALLIAIARRIRSRAILLCVAGRPESPTSRTQPLAASPEFDHVELQGLSDDAILRILLHRSNAAKFEPRVARRLLRLADGNPLFALEFYREQIERGAIVETGQCVEPGPAFDNRQPPRRVEEVVTSRLHEIASEDRDVLDVAAVDGFEFDGDALAAVLERPLIGVLRRLQTLYRERGIVVPQENGYTFSHHIVQDVIYHEVAPAYRQVLHAKLAEHLEQRAAADPERIAVHWERSGHPNRARPHLLRAAIASEKRQQILRAIDLFERAGLARAATPEDSEAMVSYAVCLSDRGRPDEAEAVYCRILVMANEQGDVQLGLRASVKRARSLFATRGAEVVDEEQMLRAGEQLPDSPERGLAFANLGTLYRVRGDLDRAREYVERAAGIYEQLGHIAGLADMTDQMATHAALRGNMEEAEKLYAEAARLARSVGYRANAAISDVNRGLRAFQSGRFEGIPEALEQAVRTLEIEGIAGVGDRALLILGHVQYGLGQTAAARATAESALVGLEASGNLAGLNAAHVMLAQLSTVTGELDSALSEADQARDLADRAEYSNGVIYADIASMVAHCHAGATDESLRAAESARLRSQKAGALIQQELFARIAELIPFGYPPAWLRDLEAPDADCATLRDGVVAMVDEGAPALIESAGEFLLASGHGERRAERRILGRWLVAEASLRNGYPRKAQASFREALDGATELGHVWYEAQLSVRAAAVKG